ncbi:MAG: hypothetical protein ISS31_08845 [Kiritimatiellae bacterium]|nr:hypothetical protein [Kiritimatiellia bacterium]
MTTELNIVMVLSIAGFLLGAGSGVAGGTYTGTGYWDEDANWSGNVQPTTDDLVGIRDDDVTVRHSGEVCDRYIIGQGGTYSALTIESGSLTTDSGTASRCGQTAHGSLTISGGVLTHQSSHQSIGSASNGLGTVTISGGIANLGNGMSAGSIHGFGTVSIVGSTADINVTNTVTFHANSTLNCTFDSGGITTMDIDGVLTVNAGADLTVDVSSWPSNGTAGAQHDLVTFTTAPANEFNATVTGCADGYMGVIEYDNDSMFVIIVEDNAIIYDFFESGSFSNTSYVQFQHVGTGRVRASTERWDISPEGTLTNSALGWKDNNEGGDNGMGWAIDLAGISGEILSLRFDYMTATNTEKVIVHIYGYVNAGSVPGSDTNMLYLNSNAGNLWTQYTDHDTPATDCWEMWDFTHGYEQSPGVHNGQGGDARQYSGSLTTVSVDEKFYLSHIQGDGPTDLSGYDYLVLAIARGNTGSGTPKAMIDNLRLLAMPAEVTLLTVK